VASTEEIIDALDRESPVPLYEQLAKHLQKRIIAGDYPVGTRLDNHHELARRFEVSAITVRRAIKYLSESGWLATKQGKGTFVVSSTVVQERLAGLLTVNEVLEARGVPSEVEIVMLKLSKPDADACQALGVSAEDRVLEIRRRHTIGSAPIAYAIIMLPESYGRTMTAARLQTESVYQILEADTNTKIQKATQRIRSIAADRVVARLLHLREGEPVLEARRVTYSADGYAVEYMTVYYRADKYEYQFDAVRDVSMGSHPGTGAISFGFLA